MLAENIKNSEINANLNIESPVIGESRYSAVLCSVARNNAVRFMWMPLGYGEFPVSTMLLF